MTDNPSRPLMVLALLAVVAATAAWPPAASAGRAALDIAADAYRVIYFDGQSTRFGCM